MSHFDNKPKKPTNPPNRMGPNRIATLANISSDDHENSTGSEMDDDDEGQAFYAGGSVHSGQQVLGPSKKTKDNKKIVKDMFKSAISHGAEVVDRAGAQTSTDTSQVVSFRGPGYTIGSSSGNPVVQPPLPPQAPSPASEVVLKAWRNGFSVDDGPLRDYNDPQNMSFLEDVKHGRVPRELLQKLLASQGQTQRGDFHLNLEDHSNEDYVPPKKVLQAFSGTGHRLGSPAPPISSSPPPASASGNSQDHETEAKTAVSIDNTKPTTSVQVRLTDGTKLVIRLNHSHTVNDIRRYIVTARPQYGALVFALMNPSTFPVKEIDDNLTVKDANLLNALVVLRLK